MAEWRLSLFDPLLSCVPRWPMSAAKKSGRYLAPDSVLQRDKAELPVSGRSRRPAIEPLLSSESCQPMSAFNSGRLSKPHVRYLVGGQGAVPAAAMGSESHRGRSGAMGWFSVWAWGDGLQALVPRLHRMSMLRR